MLRSPGQYTVFAPTDAAFKRLPAGSLDALFKDARTLRPFLCNHMMAGAKAANDILPASSTAEGRRCAQLDGSGLINGARSSSDIRATNGVIHAIDDVLVPLNPILAAVADLLRAFGATFAFSGTDCQVELRLECHQPVVVRAVGVAHARRTSSLNSLT